MADLLPLYREIGQRCAQIVQQRPDWPCCRGCDNCCRNLAEPQWLVRAEWQQIEEALAGLEPAVAAGVVERLEEAAAWSEGPLVCPFLDTHQGICRIYDQRPSACRTYGFYRGFDGGRFCQLIARDFADAEVVWGNQQSIDRRLTASHGPAIPLAEWFRQWRQEQAPSSPEAGEEP